MKHDNDYQEKLGLESRPARGAWIETMCCLQRWLPLWVAPRTGRVD